QELTWKARSGGPSSTVAPPSPVARPFLASRPEATGNAPAPERGPGPEREQGPERARAREREPGPEPGRAPELARGRERDAEAERASARRPRPVACRCQSSSGQTTVTNCSSAIMAVSSNAIPSRLVRDASRARSGGSSRT